MQAHTSPPGTARRHFRALANATGLEPCAFGIPRGSKRLRTGILTETATLEIVDDGPPPVPDTPYWAEAVTNIRATVLAAASVHASATTAVGQLTESQRLATRIAQRSQLAIAGGDWNCYTPANALTGDELAALPLHLRASRTRVADSRLTASYDADPVPVLSRDRRFPPDPPATGSHPRACIDRFYLWPVEELLSAVVSYHQQPNPGSDHQMLMVSPDPAALACVVSPGPRP